jgi:hypothetical protein
LTRLSLSFILSLTLSLQKYEKEDNEYNQNIEAIFKQQQQQPLTPRDFEVDIKFWLTEVKIPIFFLISVF